VPNSGAFLFGGGGGGDGGTNTGGLFLLFPGILIITTLKID
jgi:hypothetical protein